MIHPNPYLDSIIAGGDRWSSGIITYYLSNAYGTWTNEQRDSFRTALQSYSNVANLTFVEVNNQSSANLVEYVVSNAILGVGTPGLHGTPQDAARGGSSGGLTLGGNGVAYGYFNYQDSGFNTLGLRQGGLGYNTFVHELGHALGLAHPHDSGYGSTTMPGVTSPFDSYGVGNLNQGIFTVMSYNLGWDQVQNPEDNGFYNHGFVNGPSALDIAALQYLYGANTSYRSENNSYWMVDSNDEPFVGWTAIWDTGGYDIIFAFESENVAVTVNLTPATLNGHGGVPSYTLGVHGGYTIAHGVIIEGAQGAAGADTITGNHVNNGLFGAGGNDRIDGGQESWTLQWGRTVIGELNGDGRRDLLQINNDGYVYAWESLGAHFGPYSYAFSGVTASDRFGDVTGDNRTDVVQVYNGRAYVDITDPVGHGFSVWGTGFTDSDRLADVNGDSRTDVVQIYAGRAYVTLSNGSSFTGFNQWGSGFTAGDRFADFNADGRADLLQVYNGRAYVALSNGTSFGNFSAGQVGFTESDQLADVNGDGRMDVVQFYNGRAYVALSNGIGFNSFSQWGQGFTSQDQLGDLNGDGRADVVQIYNGTAYAWLSTGAGFGTHQVWGTGFTSSDRLVSLTADNRVDILQLYDEQSYVAVSNGTSFQPFRTWGSATHTSDEQAGLPFAGALPSLGDQLTGGQGNDTFVFRDHWGQDTIEDFQAGPGNGDCIEFLTAQFSNFASVIGNTYDDGHGNSVIFSGTDSIILQGVLRATLNADDFIFV